MSQNNPVGSSGLSAPAAANPQTVPPQAAQGAAASQSLSPAAGQSFSQSGFQPATMNDQMIVSPQFYNTMNNDPAQTSLTTGASPEIPFTYEQFPTLNGFIRTQIGRRVRADFMVGSNNTVTKDGYLVGVGTNYLLINEIGTKIITAGDFYNLKFISFPY